MFFFHSSEPKSWDRYMPISSVRISVCTFFLSSTPCLEAWQMSRQNASVSFLNLSASGFSGSFATRGRGVVLCLRHHEHAEQVPFGLTADFAAVGPEGE